MGYEELKRYGVFGRTFEIQTGERTRLGLDRFGQIIYQCIKGTKYSKRWCKEPSEFPTQNPILSNKKLLFKLKSPFNVIAQYGKTQDWLPGLADVDNG